MDGTAQPPNTPPKSTEIARRLPRHDTDNRVVLTMQRPDGPETVRGRAANISEAGFGAILAGELQLEEVVHAKLVLRSLDEPLVVQAQVKNRHGFSHGFAFLDITTEQRRTVMRYLRSASHEDTITVEAAQAMNEEHAEEPHGVTGKFRISPDAYEKKPDAEMNGEDKKPDGSE